MSDYSNEDEGEKSSKKRGVDELNDADSESAYQKVQKTRGEEDQKSKTRFDPSKYLEKAAGSQGWKLGQGLGKESQGIVDPIEAQQRFSRSGLGYEGKSLDVPEGFQAKRHQIDLEKVWPHRQEPIFLSYEGVDPKELKLKYEISIGKKDGIQPKTNDLFCSDSLINQLNENKNRLETIPPSQYLKVRSKANPYERLGKGPFINRAALKMANLDSIFSLTRPDFVKEENLLFADVCAGPGGFTEYILWRMQEKTRGWGFTLKGDNDFKVDSFSRSIPNHVIRNFVAIYGEDGSGDVTSTKNLRYFEEKVKKETNGKGLHLFVADGGFDVSGDENAQETMPKQLILCEIISMFSTLGVHGNFFCKIFDVFTPFTVGLMYILYRSFRKICIIKPITSRPANSERYIVGIDLIQQNPSINEELFRLNDEINNLKKEDDIIHILDEEMYLKDEKFMNYMKQSNLGLIDIQLESLETIYKYVEDQDLIGLSENTDVPKRCFEEWDIPERRNHGNQRNSNSNRYDNRRDDRNFRDSHSSRGRNFERERDNNTNHYRDDRRDRDRGRYEDNERRDRDYGKYRDYRERNSDRPYNRR